jgi:rhamnosyltransferase
MTSPSDLSEPRGSAAPKGSGSGRGVCGIVVTYNPEPRMLGRAIEAAVTQLDHLIVVDNGSRPSTVEQIQRLVSAARVAGHARITEQYYPSNQGLPVRFNEAIRSARAAGDRFALLLDHDSVLQPEAARRLLEAHDQVSGSHPLSALEACNEEPVVLPTDDFLAGYWRRRSPGLPDGLTDDFLGTNSGLFVSLEVLERVGGFDESYFLDAVDFEFTLRLRAAGGRLLQVAGARIWHQRGETARSSGGSRSPPLRRIQPIRHYYVARDVLRTWGRYWRRFPLVGMLLLSMPLREVILVLLYYNDRRTHLHYLGIGTLHALRGVRGPMPTAGP